MEALAYDQVKKLKLGKGLVANARALVAKQHVLLVIFLLRFAMIDVNGVFDIVFVCDQRGLQCNAGLLLGSLHRWLIVAFGEIIQGRGTRVSRLWSLVSGVNGCRGGGAAHT